VATPRKWVLGMLARPDWMEQGACRGVNPETFHPLRGEDTRPAKAICAECPVREECLAYALSVPEKQGVWGGVSERQRREMRRRKVA